MAARITDFRFLEPLRLRRDLQGRGRWMIVDRDYPFAWEEGDVRWYRAVVPADMETDLATIPQWAQWLISKLDAHVEAAVIHDCLYRYGGNCIYATRTDLYGRPLADVSDPEPRHLSRLECDRIFLAAMRTARVARWKRGLMFAAVRVGAWWAYTPWASSICLEAAARAASVQNRRLPDKMRPSPARHPGEEPPVADQL